MSPLPTMWERERQHVCPHPKDREQIVASRPTDSDSEIFTLRCSDCGAIRREERVGSVCRAEGFTDEEWAVIDRAVESAENFTGRYRGQAR